MVKVVLNWTKHQMIQEIGIWVVMGQNFYSEGREWGVRSVVGRPRFLPQIAPTDTHSLEGSTPDELTRTIQSHLWLASLEISSGIAPAMSTTSLLPREPHPDGPTIMTWHQLEDAQKAIPKERQKCLCHAQGSCCKHAYSE